MRIGILSQFFGHGGIGGHVRTLAENLVHSGIEVFVFTSDALSPDQVPDYVFPLPPRLMLGWRLLGNCQLNNQVRKTAARKDLDLLHGNPSASFGTCVARHLEIPHVATVHGSVRFIRKMLAQNAPTEGIGRLSSHYAGRFSKFLNAKTEVWMEEREFRESDAVIAVSPSVRDFYNLTCGIRRLHVIPPFVERLSPDAALDLRDVIPEYDEDKTYFLFIGPPTAEKGFGHLLDAVPHLARELADFTVLLAGPGYGPQIISLIQERGLTRFLLPLGWLSPTRLASVMRICRALIVTSLAEGHPVSVAEAMFQSLPAVGFQTMGVRDVIQHQKTGILVPMADIPSLVLELTQLAGNAEDRAALGLAALKEAEVRYDPRRLVAKTIDVYKTAMDAQT